MRLCIAAASALALSVAPAVAGPPVEAGDPLAPCVGGSKVEGSKADGAGSSQSGPHWGVEIASSFSEHDSLDAFAQAKKDYADILGDYNPTVVEVCDLSMGTDLRYSARVALGDRDAADKLCAKLQAAGGACIVLKN